MRAVLPGAFENMSADAKKAFPDAKFVFVLKWDDDPDGDTTVDIFVADTYKALPDTTDLRGMLRTPSPPVLLDPGPGNVLRIISPDATIQACTTVPRYKWASVQIK